MDSPTESRVGIGYDSHRFAPARPETPLILGGIRIPSEVYLAGHSDGDAVAHALTDAILGACALGDIGEMFPDTTAENKGKDSLVMLAAAVQRIEQQGYRVNNADITVITEQPKIGPHRAAMRDRLAQVLKISTDAISIKGKTNEKMGWIGACEGLGCIAVATVIRTATRQS